MDTGDAILGTFVFDPEDPIYEDHFPGHAVVPGSLIVHAFMKAAQQMEGAPESWRLSNFRFKRFVIPGRYHFRIERCGTGRLACTLYQNDEPVVTGFI